MRRVQSNAALEVVVGLPCCGWLQQRALNLGLSDVRNQPRGDRAHDLVLDREHVIETSVVALGPEMGTGGASISCTVMRARSSPRRTLPCRA